MTNAMLASQTPEFADVLNRVTSWPPQLRIALARQVLESVEATRDAEPSTLGSTPFSKQRVAELLQGLPVPGISVPPRTLPMGQVIGVLRPEGPTPTDAECEQILEDERLRKYG
jgi:hypothetical protein